MVKSSNNTAYHMNKISIVLDGAVPNEEIYHHIDLSYNLTKI
ncbi:hypothetical protein [Oceanobacillus caeni]